MAHQITNLADLEFHARINLLSDMPSVLTLLGPPGVAKTAWIKYEYTKVVAEVHGVRPEDVFYDEFRTAGEDAVEGKGLKFPTRDDEGDYVTQSSKPDLIVKLYALAAEHAYVVYNFDELPQGQNDMLNVLRDALNMEQRTLAGWPIPDNIIFTATGNRAADKSGAKRLPSHVTNVLMIFELKRDVDGWIKNYAEPQGVHPLFIELAKAHADTEGFFADAVPVEDGAYCTLRSLTQCARQFVAWLDHEVDGGAFDGVIPPILERHFASIVGHTAANMAVGFFAQYDKVPSAEDILRDPESAKVPEETGFQALAGNIAVAAAHDRESGEAVIQYIIRLRPDLQVPMATRLLRRSVKSGWSVGGPVAQAFLAKFHDLIPLAESAGWR